MGDKRLAKRKAVETLKEQNMCEKLTKYSCIYSRETKASGNVLKMGSRCQTKPQTISEGSALGLRDTEERFPFL